MRHHPFNKLLRRFTLAALISIGTITMGCAKNEAAPPAANPGIPVVVAKVVQQSMPVEVTSVGNVESASTISIKAQVSGQLLEMHFKEGDFVTKDQLLATIDSQPFQAQLDQAQAALARDQAQLKLAEANLGRDSAQEAYARAESQRYSSLMEKGLVPKENAEQVHSQGSALQETLRADQAAIDSIHANLAADQAAVNAAKLQLSYCNIYSPIDGRTGAILLKPGNLVKASDAPIVVINQVDPIFVNFTVVQQYWPVIKKQMAAGALKVSATIPQDPGSPLQGTVTFVDNAVDPATGTIHLRATFDNSQHRLWPGLYVNSVLRLSEQPDAIVVPSQAVTDGQNGQTAYVVRSDNTVEVRPVVSTRSIAGMAVVDQGLKPGETVVIDGQTRLTSGAKVQLKGQP